MFLHVYVYTCVLKSRPGGTDVENAIDEAIEVAGHDNSEEAGIF